MKRKLVMVVTIVGVMFAPAGAGAASRCEKDPGLSGFYRPSDPIREAELAPSGWTIEERLKGDLNLDGIADLVLILDQSAPAPVEDDSGQPVRALVLLTGTEGGHFRVAGVGACALFRSHGHFLVETGLKIEKDVLVINQSTMMSAGGWGATSLTERWRIEEGRPRLIGFTTSSFKRNTGGTVASDQNLLTGKRVMSSHNEFDGDVPRREKAVREAPRNIQLSQFVVEEELETIDALLHRTFPE